MKDSMPNWLDMAITIKEIAIKAFRRHKREKF
jgi:hypothetical protein